MRIAFVGLSVFGLIGEYLAAWTYRPYTTFATPRSNGLIPIRKRLFANSDAVNFDGIHAIFDGGRPSRLNRLATFLHA